MKERIRQRPTTDVIEIIHRRYYEGHSLAMLRRIAKALNKRVELRFVNARRTARVA